MVEKQLVSVIIPTYNRAHCIINCLQTIIEQTYQDLEILIIDDGSQDNTQQLIEQYISNNDFQPLIRYYRQDNTGANAARNKGLELSRGSFIVFFDSDDLMKPDRIYKQVSSMIEEKSDCCACGFVNSLSGNVFIPHLDNEKGYIGSLINWSLMGSTQSWMYKREILLKIGGYDLAYTYYDDWDLTFRYLTYSNKVSIVPESLSVYVDDYQEDRLTSKVNTTKRTPYIQGYYLKVLKWLAEEGGHLKSVNHLIFLYANEISMAYYRAGLKQQSLDSYNALAKALKNGPFFTVLRFKSIYFIHLAKLML